MFPFLAPIKSANHVEQQGTKFFVEITFLADSPYASRAPSSATSAIPTLRNLDELETVSNKSRSSEGLNKLGGSRPNSRSSAIKKTSVSSLPTSARSEGKSSPVPVKDAIPAPTRQKNKGLEMSAGMMELFGGGGTSPAPSRRDNLSKNAENSNATNDRAVSRGRGDQLSQPGPEWFEGYEKMDMTGIELPPDPNCPAEKVLKGEKSTPDFDSDWQDAKEDVLNPSGSPGFSQKFYPIESLPGPDIGAGVDDEEEQEEEEAVVEEEQQKPEYESKVGDKEEEDSGSSSKKGHPSPSENDADSAQNAEDQTNRRESMSNEETADGSGAAQSANDESKKKSSGGGEGGEMSILLVKNAQIVNDDAIFVADILVEDGVIQNVGPNLEAPEGAEVVDASGKLVLPAGIDVYTQVSESSVDDLSTGCRSAIAGGTATIIEVVRPRGAESLISAVKRVKNQLEKATCHVSLSVAITDFNGATEQEMSELVKSEGINSFVLDGVALSDDRLLELFEHVKKLGALIRIIPENKSIIALLEKKMLKLGVTGPEGYPQSRPESLEADKVNGVCVLGNLASCPVSIVQVSSVESLGAIEKARGSGALAHAEIASAAVAADGAALFSQDLRVASAHLTDIPLRKGASERLIGALSTQPLVVCTSGHRPVNSSTRTAAKDFAIAQKGSSGAEERMAVVWERAVRSGRIDPMRFVAVTSTNAAKMFNLYPKKGRIAVGADADLVIWDASAKRVLESSRAQSSQESSLYDGITVHSVVSATIVAGKIAYQNGEIVQSAGGFLRLAPNSPYLFSMVGQRDKFSNVERVERDAPRAAPVQQNGQTHKNSGEFDRNRTKVMESSIDFGGSSASRNRNPPGGRTTGFW